MTPQAASGRGEPVERDGQRDCGQRDCGQRDCGQRDCGQRVYGDVAVGDPVGPVEFALPLYRLAVAAGGNRDFNSIHHNRSYAMATNAPDAYASTFFLMGAWERAVRDWIGDAGTIRAIRGFRMRKFNLVGSVMTVTGTVTGVRLDGEAGVVTLELVSRVGEDVTVGPGEVEVTLPR